MVCGKVTSKVGDKLCVFCKIKSREHKEKIRKAHSILNKAVREGRIIKPIYCEDCGLAWKYLEAHHDNYDEPLKVRWLCRTDHSATHKRIAYFSSLWH